MEKGESRIKFAEKETALDLGVGMIGDTTAMNIAEIEELCLPLIDVRYLLLGRDRAGQTWHNDFEGRRGWSS